MSDTWCSSCKKECNEITVDQGIGPHEFWGYKGVHHDYVQVSDCCQGKVLDENPNCTECGSEEVYDEGLCFKCYELEYAEAA